MKTYTIKHIDDPSKISDELLLFIVYVGNEVNAMYGYKFDWYHVNLDKLVVNARLTICYKNDQPVGLMLARLYPSIFDPKKKILMQDLLYGKQGTRASSLLFKDFIDFGKDNANHIITMIGKKTNIKSQTLRKFGFTELETLYRMET